MRHWKADLGFNACLNLVPLSRTHLTFSFVQLRQAGDPLSPCICQSRKTKSNLDRKEDFSHADLLAITSASKTASPKFLVGLTFYVSGNPPMKDIMLDSF